MIIFSGFRPVKSSSKHDLAWVTAEGDGSIVLAELLIARFRKCNNKYLSP